MIVQPDFLDHWKTQMLVNLTEDASSPLLLLRLWGHCQQRRSSRFIDLTPAALRAICRSTIPATELHQLMLECGFIRIKGRTTIVHDWDSVNASLIRNWDNGKKGGRPTQRKPRVNPELTPSKPIREEKIREDEIEKIYAAYPLKRAKPDAFKAIRKALQKHSFPDLLSRTEQYAKVRNGDLTYVPNPATWFNQERFNDDPSTWKTHERNGTRRPNNASAAKGDNVW